MVGFDGVAASAANGEWLDVSRFDTITFYLLDTSIGTATFKIDTTPDEGVTVCRYQKAQNGAGGLVDYDDYLGQIAVASGSIGVSIMFDVKDHVSVRIGELTTTGNATVWAIASTQ